MVRRFVVLAALAACGHDVRTERPPEPALAPRARLVTDAQYRNAVRDLLAIEPPPVHTPGSTPHQFLHEDVIAIDAARLVQYRLAAEAIARQIAHAPRCLDTTCADLFAERAFRRPLDDEERERLRAAFDLGGFALVVEIVLQAPSFIYRTDAGGGTGALTVHELASALSFYLLDSIPDVPLWAAAQRGELADPDALAAEVDRLLATPRVQDRLLALTLDWLEIHRVRTAPKDPFLFPTVTDEMRAGMHLHTEAFLRDLLWRRGGSLHELLTANGGILTHPSILTSLATERRESIILRGMFVHQKLLCTPELGRPPFDAIAAVAPFTSKLSESQFAHYRAANLYCSGCHRIIDPPGRLLEHYDGLGRWRDRDAFGIDIEATAGIELDGEARDLTGAVELGAALAHSPQVARCVADQFVRQAFGGAVDDATRAYFHDRFAASGHELVELVRDIATSPAFRLRRPAAAEGAP